MAFKLHPYLECDTDERGSQRSKTRCKEPPGDPQPRAIILDPPSPQPQPASNPSPNADHPLLRLPQELRDHILSYLMPVHDLLSWTSSDISTDRALPPCPASPHTDPRPPATLQVCRQLRHDAGKLYFGTNTLMFNADHDAMGAAQLHGWLRGAIGPDCRPYCRRIRINGRDASRREGAARAHAARLEAMYRFGAGTVALMVHLRKPDGRDWLCYVGAEEGEDEEPVSGRVLELMNRGWGDGVGGAWRGRRRCAGCVVLER